jgi:ABC-type branched-subunit amino acid transport system permease subunit
MAAGAYTTALHAPDHRAMIGAVIWEPFALALVLGLIVSAGLYFAYMWPTVEPVDEDLPEAVEPPVTPTSETP